MRRLSACGRERSRAVHNASYETLCRTIAREFDGEIWSIQGTACFYTFSSHDQAIEGMVNLGRNWKDYCNSIQCESALKIGVNRGDIHAFRSWVFSEDIKMTSRLCGIAEKLVEPTIQTRIITINSDDIHDSNPTAERVQVDDLHKVYRRQEQRFLEEHEVICLSINQD